METIHLVINKKEIQAEVPSGFWESPLEDRRTYIKGRWPDVEWAGNGRGGVWASNIYFQENDRNKS